MTFEFFESSMKRALSGTIVPICCLLRERARPPARVRVAGRFKLAHSGQHQKISSRDRARKKPALLVDFLTFRAPLAKVTLCSRALHSALFFGSELSLASRSSWLQWRSLVRMRSGAR